MAASRQIIRIKMIAYTKQFRKRMKDSGNAISDFSKKTKLLSVGLAAGSVAFAGAAGAVALLGAAFVEAAKAIPQLRAFFDMARDAGVGAEKFQIWALAAHRAGVDTKRFGVILRFTDARIRQFRDGQGELTSALKRANVETQKYFENLKKSDTNGEFLDGVETFFANTTSATEKSTVAVGLWTENAGAMENVVKKLAKARKYLIDNGLLLTEEEDKRIKYAADALEDLRRTTDHIRNQGVAANVDSYLAAAQSLEELRRVWMRLLVTVSEVAVKVADSFGITSVGEMTSAVRRLSNAQDNNLLGWTHTKEQVEEYKQSLDKLYHFEVKGTASKIKAERLLEAAIADRKALLDGELLSSEKVELSAIKKYDRIIERLRTQLELARKKKELEKDPGGQPGANSEYYDQLIANTFNLLAVRDKARAALKELGKQRDEGKISLEFYIAAKKELQGVLGKQGHYYDKLLSDAKEEIKQTKIAENALFKLKAGFETLGIEEEEYLIIMAKVKKALGLDVEAKGATTALGEVEARIKEHREKLEHEAALIVAAKQLIADPNSSAEDIAAAQELFLQKDSGGGGGESKFVWELNANESTQLFLKDFQSFSGQLSEAMLDAETDWDKFWLNMIKRMTQRNLARYINDAFQGMINVLKKKNAEVVSETKDITKNIQDATGGEDGFGWGALIGGVATLGAAYIMSRNMSNANAAATGSGSGGEVEVVVNINNSTQSNVQYDGRSITESGGIKRTVIDIIVEDYSQGGTLREVLG
jgi:hypothetical protein